MEEMREALESAWEKAAVKDAQRKGYNKRYHDKKVKGVSLVVGDRVLVKECAFDRPHKLADKWSKDIFVVVSIPNVDIPVYRVRAEEGGKVRTLHRNLLLPVLAIRETESFSTKDCHTTVNPAKVETRVKTTVADETQSQEDPAVTESHESDSESEGDWVPHVSLEPSGNTATEEVRQVLPTRNHNPPPGPDIGQGQEGEEVIGQAVGGQEERELDPRRSGRMRR